MKRTIALCIALFVLSMISTNALALEKNKFGIGGRLGYSNWGDDGFTTNNGVATSIDFDNSFMFGVNGTYIVNKYFSLEVDLDYVTNISPTLTPLGGTPIPTGDLSITPLLFTGRLHYPLGYGFSPYVGAGVGYYWFSYDMNTAAFAPGDTVSWDNNYGFHFDAGVEVFYPVGNNVLALVFDFKYIWTESDIGLAGPTFGNPGSYSVDVEGYIAGVGLKYYF